MTFALADHAKVNGVGFQDEYRCIRNSKAERGTFILQTNKGDLHADCVRELRGNRRRRDLHNQISERKVKIIPRKGEYYLLDHEIKPVFSHTMFQTPTKMGKGVLVTPTVHQR